ncbi:hypothetical protein SLS58_001299 [Diplodia intermedia]|uniref:Tetratricopeptide repeat protein n=1 Tax=Diplodia intermedia TaxID=856260 RepID=A0ABR3U1U2_9PEZI
MLKWLKDSGLIRADPEKALALVDEMSKLGSSLDGPTAKKLCSDYQIDIHDIFFLARACIYPRNPPAARDLGKKIMLAASANGLNSATLYILSMAAKQDERLGVHAARRAYNSVELALARKHLRDLVERKNPEAMVFQARRLAADGRRKEAIAMLDDAINKYGACTSQYEDADTLHQQYSGQFFRDIENTTAKSPWYTLAELLIQEGMIDEAQAAYSEAAEKHDDPRAFQGLVQMMKKEHVYSARWVEYMTKAATSGSWTAMMSLGDFYSVSLEKIPPALRDEMRSLEESGDSVEWWYYYLDDNELARLGMPPGTKLIGADFWRGYNDPQTDSALHMVELNPRQALAMEWYEVAWRGQYCFSDEKDNLINEAMQKIVNRVTLQKGSKGGPQISEALRMRHRDQHHWSAEQASFERLSTELLEWRKRIFG